jgi:uncharacterized protein YtpQ (UPF0354 family)
MTEFCSRALPCIKADVIDASRGQVVPDLSPVIHDLQNGLVVAYAVDCGDAFELVQQRHLQEEGNDPEKLHVTAMSNFLAFMGTRTNLQQQGSINGFFLDGNFEASLLLVDPLWDQALQQYAPNGFVVAVPARDVLAFTDAACEEGIQQLKTIVARLFPHGDHLISPDLYQRVGGAWVKWQSK